jgi:tagatose 1,6-diphosphate aldolase GatY/KbaY
MPLVTTKEMLLDAQKRGYAVGAFNIENMEMAQAVVAAAEEMRAPVIIATTPSTAKYAPFSLFHAVVAELARNASVPIALHYDHGVSFETAMMALRAGYTSIMIDGSHESYEDNIAISSRVVAAADPCGVPIEAELGKVGGKEDDLDGGAGSAYTDPEEARVFVERTGVSSLAVAIGTAHGVYAVTPKLDVERLTEIRKVVSVPLVLHGASGISDADVTACIKRGICKVNIATELRFAYSDGVKAAIAADPDVFDPKKYGAAGRENVKAQCIAKIKALGSEGKA